MKVYLIEYGVHDYDSDVFSSLWANEADARVHAEECAQEMFDDNPEYNEMGWTYTTTTKYDDSLFAVIIKDEDGNDIEWWRVTEQEVHS